MKDSYGRTIDYLRFSVTDLCNLHCLYCMPKNGVKKKRHEDILRIEEIETIARAAASLGISKIRITGGEPLVRKGIEEIVRRVSALPGIQEVCLTTNGHFLQEKAEALAEAGLSRVNISLDALDASVYAKITGGGDLFKALSGIEAAIQAGLTPIKINCVLMKGVNEGEIERLAGLSEHAEVEVRFLELMPIATTSTWSQDHFLTANEAISKVPGNRASIDTIEPISHSFCSQCNRIRVTADGWLRPCLHSETEILLRGLSYDKLLEALKMGIRLKPQKHLLNRALPLIHTQDSRPMYAIGG
ncbi:MAG: GTP 3',8-cyclase MoaA [Clostridiales Family XIII bacterium]|jgi:cyclic pyranopterin phosphate synthase|nr:GTP 3',8-cyclase MoaA [Clostridiales Family XIII bacterium]